MKYPEYKAVNYAEIADQILEFWNENEIFKKSITTKEGNPTFTFFEGPPSANGTPGIHHVMARAIKDIFCRYKTLKGFQVNRKGGWDTHGLPVELQVEKNLGITKEDIGKKISVIEYNQKCRETVMQFTDQWNELTLKMGYWVDLENPYVTYENNYIESIWFLLKELYKKGLLYKGYTIQPYSPAAGTGLSSHEINQPGCYREVKDTSITAQFKVKKDEKSAFIFEKAEEEVFILAWTTTPWTLPSNAALTIGKNIEYALVKTFNAYTFLPSNVILAKDLITKYFSEKGKDSDFEGFLASDKKVIPWKILYTFKGSQMEGVNYEQLMPYVQPEKAAFRVIIGDFVTTEDGTGVVHTAPTFGVDDFRVAMQNDIPPIMVKDDAGKDMPLVDKRGRFVKEVTDFALEFVKEDYLTEEEKGIEIKKQGKDKYLSVDERIAIKLKTENRAFNVQRFEHPYPHCWRTDKPILYYPLDSWFIKTTAMKERLVELNKTINWKPESTGTRRFGNWLENLVDWNLSRSRFWGTPLPIWRNEFDEEVCIGSVQELIDGVKNALSSGKLTEEQVEKNKVFVEGYESYLNLTPDPSPGERGDNSPSENRVNRVFRSEVKPWLEKLKTYSKENRKNQTHSETIIWEELRNNKLGVKFRRQHAIEEYIVDFVCISLNLVIEIDGEIHNSEEHKEFDKIREEYLSYEGFKVIRFTNSEIKDNLQGVLNSIKEEIKAKKQKSDYYKNKREANAPLSSGEGQGVRSNSFDLHRPYVDEIYLVSDSGKVLFREPDLIDVWFDSGAMPFAQWHYPFENKDKIESLSKNGAYPADFISEGVDQTRGWFFTLHAISGMLFDSVAFKNVVSTGLVLDKNGNKMSKRLGNAVDPFETLKNYGADPTRWYMITNAQPWDNLKFDQNGILEVRNKFFGTLTNTYNFFALYGNLDNFKASFEIDIADATELDKWVLSKLQTLIKEVDEAYETYEPTKAGRLIQDYVCDHLSNWFVRLSRRRFWNPTAEAKEKSDKQIAYETLAICLKTVSQLMAPIAPFYADWLFRNLTDKSKINSVHLSDFPVSNDKWINPDLEASMELAQKISSLIHGIRKINKIKVRQPLSKILVPVLNETTRSQISSVEELIKNEVNVKSVTYLDDASGVLSKKVKPNFKALGPKFGKDMKAVAEVISNLSKEQIREIELKGQIQTAMGLIELSDIEILTEDLPGYLTAQEGGLTVALDITITDILKQEGIARDFVNRIQNFRKDNGFDVVDKIEIQLENNNQGLVEAVLVFKEYISQEVQAQSLNIINDISDASEVEMDEYLLRLKIEVVK